VRRVHPCGCITPYAQCPKHSRPKGAHWSRQRDRAAQARFRKRVLFNAGHRCQFVEDGMRCSETAELQAHHTEPGNDLPETGVALCRAHHKVLDRYAR
jgi:predicted restriction endonuclease